MLLVTSQITQRYIINIIYWRSFTSSNRSPEIGNVTSFRCSLSYASQSTCACARTLLCTLYDKCQSPPSFWVFLKLHWNTSVTLAWSEPIFPHPGPCNPVFPFSLRNSSKATASPLSCRDGHVLRASGPDNQHIHPSPPTPQWLPRELARDSGQANKTRTFAVPTGKEVIFPQSLS